MAPIYWQTGKTHSECSRYMLDNEVNCDICFKVGEEQETIKAHKYTLSMRSAVFDRMFKGSFCEADSDPVIPDVTAEAFKMMLRYCYYECLDMDNEVALSVLYASTKYMLPLLEEAARKKLMEILGSSNVWHIYNYAISVADTTLLDGCHMFLQGNVTPVREALNAESFLTIPHKVLLDLLHINQNAKNTLSQKGEPMSTLEFEKYYNSCGISISEIELFTACNAWADAECLRQEIDPTGANKRTMLGECLSLIRCATMLDKDMLNVVYPTGLLTHTADHNSEAGLQCEDDLPSEERQFVVTALDPPRKADDIGTLYLEPDVRVRLSRIWVRGPGPGRYRVTLRNETTEELWSMKYDTKFNSHVCDRKEGTYRFLHYLDIDPRLLQAGAHYSVTAERLDDIDQQNWKVSSKRLIVDELCPYKEIMITRDFPMQDCIHALGLCLV